MNKELFASMRAQMVPSGEARAALEEKLAAPRKRRVPVARYAAVAACAAVILAAPRAYNFIRDSREVSIDDNFHRDAVIEPFEPHSYVLAVDLACWLAENTTATGNTDAGKGDQEVAPGGLTVNTGETEMPGGAYIGEAPDQGEAIMAYQNLMARFEADYGPNQYPEWYGGAYIDEYAALVVNIAEDEEPEGKELYFQIQEWAGSDRVCFGSSRKSLNQLRQLQAEVMEAMEELGLTVGCGINEETGQVELTLPEANERALRQLTGLDPEGTDILVIVARTATTDAEEPALVAPSVSQTIQPGGTPEVPDGSVVDEDGVIAWEPQG